MQILTCCSDLVKHWVAKIKREWKNNILSKVSAFYRLFFAKEQRKVLKEKCDGNLQCDFFAVC